MLFEGNPLDAHSATSWTLNLHPVKSQLKLLRTTGGVYFGSFDGYPPEWILDFTHIFHRVNLDI